MNYFLLLSNATAGVMASFFSTFTLCPTELVKCKLQALREMNASISNKVFNETRTEFK